MRTLPTSAALCAILAAGPVVAQDVQPAEGGSDVYRNDLPETHDGLDLPELGATSAGEIPADSERPLAIVSAGALAVQQYGNLAAAKQASGAVRDLGDRMILLGSAINERLDRLGERDEARLDAYPQLMSENVRADLEVLDDLRGEPFDHAFATWVTAVHPGLIDAWTRLGESDAFADLFQAVVPRLEDQLAVPERVLSAEAGVDQLVNQGGDDAGGAGEDAEQGPEGQTGERQHTPETEQAAVQTGENYEHEQVEVDPQSETQLLPGDAQQPDVASAAGELEIVNAGAIFSLVENVPTELAQLERAPDFSADQIRVVPVGDLLAESDMASFESSLSGHEAELSQVREAIGSRQALGDALTQAGASAQDLVAFDVLDEGIVLYTRAGQSGQ